MAEKRINWKKIASIINHNANPFGLKANYEPKDINRRLIKKSDWSGDSHLKYFNSTKIMLFQTEEFTHKIIAVLIDAPLFMTHSQMITVAMGISRVSALTDFINSDNFYVHDIHEIDGYPELSIVSFNTKNLKVETNIFTFPYTSTLSSRNFLNILNQLETDSQFIREITKYYLEEGKKTIKYVKGEYHMAPSQPEIETPHEHYGAKLYDEEHQPQPQPAGQSVGIERVFFNMINDALNKFYQEKKDIFEGANLKDKIVGDLHPLLEKGLTNHFKAYIDENLNKHREIVIKDEKREAPIHVGKQHYMFEKILSIATKRVPLMLVGPAGAGKTTLAQNIAKALSLPFHPQSVGSQTTKSDLIGYMDANGKYIPSALRKAFENGGVYLMDEIDAGNANVITILNACISNTVASFPDGTVARNDNFIVLAAANTYGRGSNRQYVGRNQLDAATLDRFAVVDFDYDEDFELSLANNDKWVAKIQALRKAAEELKERIIISPRASINGAQLLAAGFKQKETLELVVFKGIQEDLIKKLVARAVSHEEKLLEKFLGLKQENYEALRQGKLFDDEGKLIK